VTIPERIVPADGCEPSYGGDVTAWAAALARRIPDARLSGFGSETVAIADSCDDARAAASGETGLA